MTFAKKLPWFFFKKQQKNISVKVGVRKTGISVAWTLA